MKKVKTQFETQFQEYIQNTILEKKSPYSLSRIKWMAMDGWMTLILSIWMRCETFKGNPVKCSNAKSYWGKQYVDDTQSEILETIDCKYVINLAWNTN